MTNVNYANRTVDYLIEQGLQSAGMADITLALGDNGKVCTGIQKLAQVFVKLFLTEKGSVLYDPFAGTGFLEALHTGKIRDETSLQSYFRFAVMDIANYLEAYANPADKDEQLEDAVLLSYDLQRDRLSLRVKIISLVGDERTVIFPVETVIK